MTRSGLTVLMVDKHYFVKGGAERYAFELTALLESQGHRVVPFAMHHPSNRPTAWARHFVSYANFGADGSVRPWQGPRLLARAIYSVEAARKLRGLLAEVRPDVAHLHMIDHQISPSILPVLRAAGVPIVQTVHQYKAVCPSYLLYDELAGRPCELCVGSSTWHAVRTRCHRGSLLSSTALAVESAIHRMARVNRLVDLFHAPSRFAAGKLQRGGCDPARIRCFPYAIDVARRAFRSEPGGGVVYAGRLAQEKGLDTLLDAMAGLPEIALSLIGEGPRRVALEARAARLGLRNVAFRGRVHGRVLEEAIASAALLVLPSASDDNSPLVIYESFAVGTPVLASRAGGIPELVDDGATGVLFERGNAGELREKLRDLMARPAALAAMRRRCRSKAEGELSWAAHRPRVEACYEALLSAPRR